MKKLFFILVTLVASLAVNAQSIQLHQSYNDNKSTWGNTRLIVDFFWSNDNINVFSWNTGNETGMSNLLYAEFKVAKNLYIHPEIRTQFNKFSYNSCTPQIGIAYRLPINSVDVYLTPKYSHNDIYAAKDDIQVSVNSSYDSNKVYYEGYLDTNYINDFNLFAEQKAYYKITDNFQIGGCAVVSYGNEFHVQPYASLRVQL